MRVMRRFGRVYIDQIDAVTYTVGEEVTLLRWGNMRINEIVKGEDGKTVTVIKATYNAEATNFSKTKKATWLAAVPDVVACKLVEFDHLISKAKLEEDEKFQDFVNPVTRLESDALCDPCLRTLNEGEVIQLERKGFYRVDKPYNDQDKVVVLFAIPDGKAKTLNPSATPAVAPSKKK
jgi:glutamyl-tRNA synthetase